MAGKACLVKWLFILRYILLLFYDIGIARAVVFASYKLNLLFFYLSLLYYSSNSIATDYLVIP